MEKVIIYQVFTRVFGNKCQNRVTDGTLEENGSGKFADFDTKTLNRIKELGTTHVWYTGVIRHATATDYSAHGIPRQHPDVVKGKAGSPYAICDYYDVDPDLATDVDKRMEEWEQLIQRTHEAGLKVVMDFVPNHVARQYHSIAKPKGVRDLGDGDRTDWHFSPMNNFYYCVGETLTVPVVNGRSSDYHECPARATGNDRFTATPGRDDWYETIKLNYGIDYCDWSGHPSEHFSPVPDTWEKMTQILLFWAAKGVDAFRCDMAEMVPTAFWHYASGKLKERYPEIKLIGEVYNPALYRAYIGAGFDWLYDKVGMYDTLRAVSANGCATRYITQQWQSVDDIRKHMLYFLENHDEQRIASDFFCGDAVKALPALVISALLYTNPFMLYAGEEFGEKGMDAEGFSGRDGRTTIFDYWCVDSLRRGYYDRRKLTTAEKALEKYHKTIMNMALNNDVFSKGKSYDLMYVNPELTENQYAFMRSHEGKWALVVVNFCEYDVPVEVNIPANALEYMGIKAGKCKLTDLLNGGSLTVNVQPDCTIGVTVPGHSAVVLG